ncbi:hypothetical protein ADK66_06850 [Micromonospora sp. NRRL B-16802]|nr:hypothetical protein ADK66_06850 [Micromonospora sp. NRRL B-16802]
MHTPGDQDGEHTVAAGDRPLDDGTIVRRPRDDCDSALELVQLVHAARTAHADDLVALVQRVPDHVPAKFS